MALPNIANEAHAAAFLRVPEEQLKLWRDDNDGPEYTSLRNGGALYDQRDLKVWLREQMEARKAVMVE